VKLPSLRGLGRRESVSGLENPSVDLIQALTAHIDGATSSSVSMTPLKAFRLAAVYACVRVIAESVASLPIDITQADTTGEGRVLVRDDDRRSLLNEQPNPEMTGIELLENWIGHALLWGKGYLYIVFNKKGQPIELWPLKPDVTFERRTKDTNRLYYETEDGSGKVVKLMPEEVIPIKALFGASPVMNAKDMLATAAAAQEYAGRFWANNARPGGLIELPETMDDDEMDEFIRRWKAGHEGLKRAQLVGILTAGATWKEVGIAPGQAQFIETRQFGTREIARMYGVPPHRVGDMQQGGGGGTGNGNSLEQQSIEFVTYTLRAWIVRAEQALRNKLFVTKQDLANDTQPRFNFAELMRGDLKSRYDAFAVGIQWGFLNRAGVRRSEGLAAGADEDNLEEYLVPLNMIPSSRLDEIDVGGSTSKSGGGGDKNQDNGGTQPTTGSDGSTPQTNALALLAGIMRDRPELAEAIGQYAIERVQRALPAGDDAE
jgi:HK97 family phage portal protein